MDRWITQNFFLKDDLDFEMFLLFSFYQESPEKSTSPSYIYISYIYIYYNWWVVLQDTFFGG